MKTLLQDSFLISCVLLTSAGLVPAAPIDNDDELKILRIDVAGNQIVLFDGFTCPNGLSESVCTPSITAPSSGALITSSDTVRLFTEVDSINYSDQLNVLHDFNTLASYTGGWFSDTDQPPSPCTGNAASGPCQPEPIVLTEEAHVNWSDGTVDHVYVKSDADPPVPEPGTLLMFGSGLVGLAMTVKGKRCLRHCRHEIQSLKNPR